MFSSVEGQARSPREHRTQITNTAAAIAAAAAAAGLTFASESKFPLHVGMLADALRVSKGR